MSNIVNGSDMKARDVIAVWDVEHDAMIEVTRAEAAAGMLRYAHSLGRGTPACGEVERQALALLHGEGNR
jgi:hypothetical protein